MTQTRASRKQRFNFHSLQGPSNATEANIFFHGYSAGHNREDKNVLLESVPDTVRHYTNIFAFWRSSHFSRFNRASRQLIETSTTHMGFASGAATAAVDRTAHFLKIRSRAEDMGEALLDQLDDHLRHRHPKIDTINLIGHSLGGRLVVNCLKRLADTSGQRLAINDVLLMAAAVEVTPAEALQMRGLLNGRLINAYSKSDWTLLMPLDESCLGRNVVEHFENIKIDGFGHGDYWKRLPEVFARTQFKSLVEIPLTRDGISAFPDSLPTRPNKESPVGEHAMTLDLSTPADVYRRINEELSRISGSLAGSSTDATLDQARDDARNLLAQHQVALQAQLAELETNAEWKTFTIAFYGETGAGKSTIIETLRILLQEPSKVANQQRFRELQSQYSLSEKSLQQQQKAIDQIDAWLTELALQISATLQRYEQLHRDALSTFDQAGSHFDEVIQQLSVTLQQHNQLHSDAVSDIARLKVVVVERKQAASLWQKLLNVFRKMPEEVELARVEKQLPEVAAARERAGTSLLTQQNEAQQSRHILEQQLAEIVATCDDASSALLGQQTETEKHKRKLTLQQHESESHLAELLKELESRADGEIIGDGRADFTRQTQRYDFVLDGQPFALLDVPGIEGNEGLIHNEIERAVQTAHAVFYVTNQAAPPQTGDEQRKGTLEKIKAHLGAQTEVWTIFNKKIINAKHSLTGRPLTSDDENTSLTGLDEKMREQLGDHYREVFPLTALSAFLASTDHFAPDSQNAKRREKVLADFNSGELLEKSRLRDFLQLLGSQLLHGSKGKIKRANLHKANEALSQTVTTIGAVQGTFAELSEKLKLDEQSAQVQLVGSFIALKTRLEATSQRQIDEFSSRVRNAMYGLIEGDVGNEYFKDALKDRIYTQQEQLNKKIPELMGKEVERFRKDIGDILERFAERVEELIETLKKIGETKVNDQFKFDIKMNSGIKIAGLVSGLLGIALAPFTGGGSLWLLGASALSVVVSIGKALVGVFSTDYKKSQQRKAVDDNLYRVTEQLRNALRGGLQNALPEMQDKIDQIEQALAAPVKQTEAFVQLLNQSASQLKVLSRQIDNVGSL